MRVTVTQNRFQMYDASVDGRQRLSGPKSDAWRFAKAEAWDAMRKLHDQNREADIRAVETIDCLDIIVVSREPTPTHIETEYDPELQRWGWSVDGNPAIGSHRHRDEHAAMNAARVVYPECNVWLTRDCAHSQHARNRQP